MPELLIGDKAYDSDALNERLAEMGIELTHTKQTAKAENAGRPQAQALQTKVESGVLRKQ
jgi:DNA-binding GntR family transcriptional regulator